MKIAKMARTVIEIRSGYLTCSVSSCSSSPLSYFSPVLSNHPTKKAVWTCHKDSEDAQFEQSQERTVL